MQQYILGIDIGTGSTKAVAVDLNGSTVATSQHYYPVKSVKPGYAEQNPAQIFEAFKTCVTDVTSKLGQPTAISFSSAMHSIIPVDANGIALADMIIWADARAEQIAHNLKNSEEGIKIYRSCGTPIHAMAPLCKLIWLRENEPALFEKASKFVSIKEYVWFKLFNEFKVDYSIASATGLFNITQLKWSTDACQLAGITSDELSAPVETTYHCNNLAAEMAATLQIDQHTPFVIGASDGCCANLGSFVADGVAALTIGTSGAVRITHNQPVIDDNAMPFNYLLNQNTFVSGGAVNNGGGTVQWLIKTFLDKQQLGDDEYNEFFSKAATVAPGSNFLIFLPYLNGERSPLWDAQAGGVFFNIRQHHTKAHFLRAGLEGICFALLHVLETLEELSVPIKKIHISGGFIHSPLWVQVLADITGKPLVIVQQEDASAFGAIFLAAEALKLPGSIIKPTLNENAVTKPNLANHELYKTQFQVFKQLYTQLKGLMHKSDIS